MTPPLHNVFLILACLLGIPAFTLAGTSNSLLDVSRDGRRLLVANPDNDTVTVVDAMAHKALREITVGDRPEGVTWVGTGPLAAVTLFRADAVVLFDADTGRIVQSLAVADEPYGIVAAPDGSRLWVSHDYPGTVAEIRLQKKDGNGDLQARVAREMKVGSFTRGLAVSADGTRLYVTEYYTSALHAVDVERGTVVGTWKGRSVNDNLSRQVVLHPRRPKAYLPHLRSKIETIHGNGSIFPHLSICDLRGGAGGQAPPIPLGPDSRSSIALDSYLNLYVVNNPWEAAITPDGTRLLTVHAGSDDMYVHRVIDDDYREVEADEVVRVGRVPKAVRVSPDGRSVYVYNTSDYAVGVYQAGTWRRVASIPVCQPPHNPEWVRGKYLWETALSPLTSRRWISCASCHMDGLTDGRVWHNPEGLRKTPALAGLAHTHPLHWSADRDEVQDFEYTIRGKLMQGRGLLPERIKPKAGFAAVELEEKLSGRSKDLDALAAYTNAFEHTLSPHIPAPGKLSDAAERGRQLFLSKETGCASCHSGPYYTDSSLAKPYKLHDVGTGTDDPSEKMGPKYDTPTLLGVYRSAPYLHHGKAKTLRDVLTTCNPSDRHGRTSHLKPNEIDDMAEFLKSLPYEKPPAETPNTVQTKGAGTPNGAR